MNCGRTQKDSEGGGGVPINLGGQSQKIGVNPKWVWVWRGGIPLDWKSPFKKGGGVFRDLPMRLGGTSKIWVGLQKTGVGFQKIMGGEGGGSKRGLGGGPLGWKSPFGIWGGGGA